MLAFDCRVKKGGKDHSRGNVKVVLLEGGVEEVVVVVVVGVSWPTAPKEDAEIVV